MIFKQLFRVKAKGDFLQARNQHVEYFKEFRRTKN